jgi:hypothetical protein
MAFWGYFHPFCPIFSVEPNAFVKAYYLPKKTVWLTGISEWIRISLNQFLRALAGALEKLVTNVFADGFRCSVIALG